MSYAGIKIPGIFSFPASEDTREINEHELAAIWWLWLPIAFFVARYAISIFTPRNEGLESLMIGELGLVENLTVLLLMGVILGSLYLIRRYRDVLHLTPRLFLFFFCLGGIYFAGEEASWGQHWFGWETGEYFAAINDQHETNLHNTSEYFDRIPKAIVSFAIFLGGIALPLYLRRKEKVIDCRESMWWLFPTWICLPTAVFAVTATWPSKIERFTDWKFYFDGAQKMKELYIAYFFLLFIVSLGRRLHLYQANGVKFSAS